MSNIYKMSTEDPISGILRFSWTVILQPLLFMWCQKAAAAPTAYTSLTAEENKLMGAFLAMPPEVREKELLDLVKLGREAVREQR